MKTTNFFFFRVYAMIVAAIMLFGCVRPVVPETPDEVEPGTEFALEVKSVGPDYVELLVAAPSEVEIAYRLGRQPMALSPVVLFSTGVTTTVSPGDVLKITRNVTEDTSYYLYAVAKLDVKNYSKVVSVEFTTAEYEFSDFITVVDTYYDGYKVHVTVPEETKARGHVIRASSMPLALYNLNVYAEGQAAFDLKMIGSMGDPYSGHFFDDSTFVCGSTMNLEYDEDGKPIVSEDDMAYQAGEPIAPGEPTIFYAGECRYGTKEEFSQVMGYYQPERDSWSIPYFDRSTWSWLGAFDKKVFMTRQPDLCDCTVNVDIPEDEITVNDAMVYFDADEDVTRYFYMVLDDATYNQILSIYLDGHEDWYQWFLTSYMAFYEWGIYPETADTYVNAAANFVEPLAGGEKYHVLVTVMGDEIGATQNFIHKTFTTKEKTKLPPVIEVKAVNTGDPYFATFNIKAPNKDVVGSYWACSYARDFEVMFNAKYTYQDILKGNYSFTSDELAMVNSDEGYTVSVPTLDGEVTRFAAYGFNDEYTFNYINDQVQGEGWADYTAPMAEKKTSVESPLFAALEGDWTASATLRAKEVLEDGSEVSRNIRHKSKVTISNSAPYVPEQMGDFIYDLYADNAMEDVDGMYEELHFLSDRFTEYRLEGQNRMLCTGFVDFDYYKNPGRMDFRSPYDLFIAEDYVCLDVPQTVYDFGPKWYLEVLEDGRVIVPFSSSYLPPMHNWPMYAKYSWEASTYYVGGVGSGLGVYDATDNYPGFPVEVSEDMNTITVKPIVLDGGSERQELYMNALGINPQDPTTVEVVATVISDIVLTRGWTEQSESAAPACAAPSKVKAVTMDGKAVTKAPEVRRCKSMTRLEARPRPEYRYDETPNIVTMDMLQETSAKYLRRYGNQF